MAAKTRRCGQHPSQDSTHVLMWKTATGTRRVEECCKVCAVDVPATLDERGREYKLTALPTLWSSLTDNKGKFINDQEVTK